MKLTLAATGLLAAALLFPGCKPQSKVADASAAAKPSAAPIVPETERSRHFNAVNAQLELGGTVYGYVDIDGDVLKLAPYLSKLSETVAEQQPMAAGFLQQDYAAILTDLGFNDVRAVGLSSVRSEKGGFRNRVYLHTPDGRRGLLAAVGGAPAPFAHARLAPADADLYAESDYDAAAVYATLRKLVARVAGEPMANVMEQQLQKNAAPLGVKPLDVVKNLKGRATVIFRTHEERTFTIPGPQPLTLPAFQFLVRVDGLGALDPALAKLPMLTVTQEGTLKIYGVSEASPIEGLQPVLAVDGAVTYLASDLAFLKESLARTEGLAQAPAFKAALAELGEQGNGLTYVSPRLFNQARRLKELNPQLPPEAVRGFDFLLGGLPEITEPLVSVRVNLPEGILYRSRWNRSLKQDVAMIGVYNPVSAGLLAAMAIPAFQKVRASSQEKAIINNLRQLSAAADQYMLENGVDRAAYFQLVGTGQNHYIRSMRPVAGEDYTKLVIRATDTEIKVTTKAGKVVRLAR